MDMFKIIKDKNKDDILARDILNDIINVFE